jgi:hypothetical protein
MRFHLSRLPIDPGTVPQRSLVHGVAARETAGVVLARPDGEDGASCISGAADWRAA